MTTRDPYEVLGVARTTTQDDIKSAYRKLAKKNHPDLNPGDGAAAARFAEIGNAYGILSDPDKRGRFDRGEIDAAGQERGYERAARGFYGDYAEGPYGAAYSGGPEMSAEDLFADLFARAGMGGGRAGAEGFRARGADVSYTLRVDFLDAVNGAKRRLTLPDGRVLDVAIPPATRDRQTLRLKGQGQPGYGGGPAGDAYVEVHVEPHALFTRKDSDIHVEIPVGLKEAVLGARIPVPTVGGEVMLNIPRHSNSGTVLRLKGRGVPGNPPGDQYVRLRIVLPQDPDPELERFLEGWSGGDHDVRARTGSKA